MNAIPESERRFGITAIIGAPNAGKSTLVNALVGSKISIVTHKVQTTRMQVRGIFIRGASQVVLVDTPGIFAPRRRLDRAMVSAAWAGASDADAVVLIVDAAALIKEPAGLSARDTETIMDGLRTAGRKAALVLNKIDEVKRDTLLDLAQRLNAAFAFERTFMISALKSDGIGMVADWLAAQAKPGPWHYPEDQMGDLPLRMLASEITREKLYLRLHDELPYSSHVATENWTVKRDGSVRIDQTIFVEREGQKAIVIGKGGTALKAIGASARQEMQEAFGHKVHLFLHVKTAENWADDPRRFAEMGLDFKSS